MMRFAYFLFLAGIFSVFKLIDMANAGPVKEILTYNSRLKHLQNHGVEIVYEEYESFVSMFHPNAHHRPGKREADGSGEGNATDVLDVLSDHHTYYSSKFYPPGDAANQLWFELGNRIGSGALVDDLTENITEVLSDSHRVYQVWGLQFKFPYYGHLLDSIAITSLGFLYTGTIYHERIYLSQYIAPLMADFNPSLSNSGSILVYSTEERFTVQWDQILNHDHEDSGPFTFQASIFPSGKIQLVYREIPLLWTQLNKDDFPVEIGISDAFYYEIPGFVLLVEYSKVSVTESLEEDTDLSYSAVEFDPVPNCVMADTCDSCMAITGQGIFNCSWCEAAEQKCSDGIDRFTQDWSDSGCFTDALSVCPLPPTSPPTLPSITPSTSTSSQAPSAPNSVAMSTVIPSVEPMSEFLSESAFIGIMVTYAVIILLAVCIVLGGCVCMFRHGYRNPTSRIGMFMIEYRPSAWRLRRPARRSEMQYKREDDIC